MSVEYMFFEANDDKFINQFDIVKVANIFDGLNLDVNDFEAIRTYAKGCKGIKREIENPSVEYLLQHGDKANAIKLYYSLHKGIEVSEARDVVNKMAEKMSVK